MGHIAREIGLDGATKKERANQDMIWELSRDITSKKDLIHKEGELDAKLVGFLEGAVKMIKSSGGPYIGGSKMGYGDTIVLLPL